MLHDKAMRSLHLVEYTLVHYQPISNVHWTSDQELIFVNLAEVYLLCSDVFVAYNHKFILKGHFH